MSSSDSEPTPILQKYSDVRLDKQSITNTLNLSKGSLQSDCPITETGLFETYININFPLLSINMSISDLKSISEITKIFRLKQTAISSFNASEAFSQMNSNFEQSSSSSPESHNQQQGHTSNSAPSNAVDMQTML